MFGRAAITLGIDPHSSYFDFVDDIMFAIIGQAKATLTERTLRVNDQGQHRGKVIMATITLLGC